MISNLRTSKFPGLTLKAWFLFNGVTGTLIKSSGITSVVRNATGVYTILFSAAAASASFFVETYNEPSNLTGEELILTINNKTVAGFSILSYTKTPAAADVQIVYAEIYE